MGLLSVALFSALMVFLSQAPSPAQQPAGKDDKSPEKKQPSVGTGKAREAIPGEVDINWAKEHHDGWLDEQMEKGNARRSAPAE